jgi:hypothetical protein
VAIKIKSDLSSGSSTPCETFDSPILASSEEFNIASYEIFVIEKGVIACIFMSIIITVDIK